MKVLLVSHNFLPGHRAGTELYTRRLGRELVSRGHDVEVFTTEKDIGLPHLALREREVDGLRVHELVNNLYYRSFRDTWDYPAAEERFAEVLDRVRPDVVHFQHLLYLSVGCVELAARRGLGVLFTLHDYWLQCPRYGQRVHFDGSICHTIDFARCGGCLTRFKYKQTDLERRVGKAIAVVRSASGLNLGPLARDLAHRLLGEEPTPGPHDRRAVEAAVRRARELEDATSAGLEHAGPDPANAAAVDSGVGDSGVGEARAAADSPETASGPTNGRESASELDDATLLMAREARHRDFELRERLRAVVHRFLAPSQFLRERFLEWGLAPEQIELLRTGCETGGPEVERTPGELLRIGFLGSLVPNKGPHVLLEAWGLLPAELRARGELVLHGPVLHNPRFVEDLRRIARRVGATIGEPLESDEVPAALARTDLLVVPSLWFENAPLVILEAIAMRTPLCVSNLGGMAELVQEGRNGFTFRTGDREHLAQRLAAVLGRPELLSELSLEAVDIPRFVDNVDVIEDLYEGARAAGRERLENLVERAR